jgi:O-antigen/teichoic acid export membrane protein
VRRLLQRAGWNLADQVLSALTNAALTIVIARTVDDDGKLGAFSVAFLLFCFLIVVERALVGQVVGIRHSDETPEDMRVVAGRGLGTVLVLGVVSGAILVGAGAWIGGLVGPALMAVGLTMAPLLMQDSARMIFFAQGHPARAALNDAVWAVVQFSAIAVLARTGTASTWSLVLAWGGAAAVCVLLAMVQLRAVPRPLATVGWIRQHRDIVGYLLPDNLLTSGGLQASTLFVGKMVGLGGMAAFRGGQVLVGPLGIVGSALMGFATPELSRRPHLTPRARWRIALGTGAAVGVVSLAYTLVLVMLPESVGTWLFRSSWDDAKSVLLPMALFVSVAGVSLGPALMLIAMGRTKLTFRVTVVETPLVLLLMPLGAWLDGAPGAAWGQFVAGAAVTPLWFATLRKALREPVAPVEAPAGSDPAAAPA